MRLSNKQKMLLHLAAKEAGVGEEQRRTVQRNVGGFYSAADTTATRQGFIAVMAFYERVSDGRLTGFSKSYWQAQDAASNPTDALAHRIGSEAAKLGWRGENVNAFLASRHMSGGLYDDCSTAPAYWLRRLLQGLIEMNTRASQRSAASQSSKRARCPKRSAS